MGKHVDISETFESSSLLKVHKILWGTTLKYCSRDFQHYEMF